MERDPWPMDNEDGLMPAPGVDVYDQPTGAPHHYLWISPLGRPRLTSCEAPGSNPPKWAKGDCTANFSLGGLLGLGKEAVASPA